MNITDLYYSDKFQFFLNEIGFFNSNNRKGIGITVFPDNKFIIKAYLEIINTDNIDIYRPILKNDFYKFKKYKNYVNFNIPSSFAIGKKIASDGEELDYYHVKFKKRFNFKNIFYKLKLLNLSTCGTGMSKEYSSKTKELKRYIYVKDEENKKLLSKIFNLNVDLSNIDHFEIYSKNQTNYKINFIFKKYNDIYESHNNVNKYVNELNLLFNKLPVYSGITNNDEISIYYSFTK